MNKPVYNAELERIIEALMKSIDDESLDELFKQSISYAYTLGKSEGYAAGVQAVVGNKQ